MHRVRIFALLLGATVLLLLSPAAAVAATSGMSLLAQSETEPVEEEVPAGPEPELDNTFQPSDYERDWTWGLALALTGVGVLAVVGTAAGYYLLVLRPQRDSEQV